MNDASTVPELERLRQFVPLFSLSEERLRELAALATRDVIKPGVHLFREGDVDNQTLYLLAGQVRLHDAATREEQMLRADTSATRHPLGDCQPRRVSAVAVTEVEVLRIDNNVLDYMITWDQLGLLAHAEDEIDGAGGEWMTRMEHALPFRNIPGANMRRLAGRMERLEVKAGDVVVQQGETGDYYYLIDEGSARVTRQIELAELAAGASFGEEALIADTERNASVTMSSDGVLLRLSKQDFDELLMEPLLNWVSPDEARERVNQGACWLDVRHSREFAHYRLHNAVNVPLHELRQRTEELDRGRQYVVYCKTGRRSSAAAFVLTQAGFQVAVLRGGLQVLPAPMRSNFD